MRAERLLPDLFLFRDTCNAWVLRDGAEAIAVDFGSGKWMSHLPKLGIRRLARVYLTHGHADQCAGLLARKAWPFEIHAPVAERAFLDPAELRAARAATGGSVCPPSYAPLPRGIPGIRFDLAGFGDCRWGGRKLRFLSTPGHGRGAVSVIADVNGRQVAFCGDAAFAGGRLWEPYHLEWHHLHPDGTLAALEGVRRLAALGSDLLCPSHGPAVASGARAELLKLAARLERLLAARGSACPGEPDRLAGEEGVDGGFARLSPSLWRFGTNGYLLLSGTGEALVVDPQERALPAMDDLLRRLGGPRLTAAVVTHHHLDHCDGVPALRRRGVRAWFHPWVAGWLRRAGSGDDPWFDKLVPRKPIRGGRAWPVEGRWRWNEYVFDVAPSPGQTWWHCAFMTVVDGRKVMFSGDNFQPPSRWYGHGGFCAWNTSRPAAGYGRSARLVLRWKPDLLACGHGTAFRFAPSHFRKVAAWARDAEEALRGLCVHGDPERDYHAPCARDRRALAGRRGA
jgi:glyoxylase-like metal-dependent hydrolase (beta-lactamase superfamily II)